MVWDDPLYGGFRQTLLADIFALAFCVSVFLSFLSFIYSVSLILSVFLPFFSQKGMSKPAFSVMSTCSLEPSPDGLNVVSIMLNWESKFDPLNNKEPGRIAMLPSKFPGSMSWKKLYVIFVCKFQTFCSFIQVCKIIAYLYWTSLSVKWKVVLLKFTDQVHFVYSWVNDLIFRSSILNIFLKKFIHPLNAFTGLTNSKRRELVIFN